MRQIVSIVLLKVIKGRNVNAEHDDASPQVLSSSCLLYLSFKRARDRALDIKEAEGPVEADHMIMSGPQTRLLCSARLTGGDNRAQTKPEHFDLDKQFTCINFIKLGVVAQSLLVVEG